MQFDTFPQTPPLDHFDRELTIRGVQLALRVFPMSNTFVFQTNRPVSDKEKAFFVNYLKAEGFLDNPTTGEEAQSVAF